MFDWVSEALERFFAFLAGELAPSQRRVIEAARNAAKSTVTTGLAAIMQIVGPFGPLFAFRIGQPGVSLGISEGALVIACAAVMQAAIVPITGKLLDYPGLIMAFLFIVFATVGYLLWSNARLFMILALVAIGTITTVYVGIFEPGQMGWGSSYTFSGILVATLVMVAFDTLIWPSPPEPRLLEFVAADLERARGRLENVGRCYLDPFAHLPTPRLTSMLARNLVLLESVREKMKPTAQRLAHLTDAVMTAEHVYLEVGRLAVLAEEPLPNEIRQNHREEIELALQTLNKAFAQKTEDILAGLNSSQDSREWISDLRVTIRDLTDLSAQPVLASDDFTPSVLSNFLGFVGGLETIGNLLESREWPLSSTTAEPTGAEKDSEARPLIDPAALRFSIKIGAAITLGLLVGLTTQRADIQTILWSTVVAGQPNQYGGVVRKTLLRLTGCILGGLAALAAMIIVSQSFDSLPPYLVVIFAVTMVSTYVSQSSEWLGYAGIQAGITFLICYVGLAPTSDVYKPLWRFWGIILGVLTTGFVFLLLWPEYAKDKLIERLNRLMRTTLAFAKEVAHRSITEGGIAAVEQRLSAHLLDVLNMADQARLEGRRGVTHSDAAIEAASTLVRIAYRFEIIARDRLAGVTLPKEIVERQVSFEEACCATLEIQLTKLERSDSPELLAKASAAQLIDLAPMVDAFTATNSTHLSSQDRIFVAEELESYRRLPILLLRLDTSLSRIATY